MLLYFPFCNYKSRVLSCKISNNDNMDKIRRWTISNNPSNITSTHWWMNDLPKEIYDNFNEIVKSKEIYEMFYKNLGYNQVIHIIDEMNELYVSPPTDVKQTSDKVFYTKHIDAPYFYIPFATCFRMIVGMDDNYEIDTIFELVPKIFTIKKGDVVAFDFHRECHYIRSNEIKKNKDYRVVLKLHYCIFPNNILGYIFGNILTRLSINYDRCFRNLFLYTLKPTNIIQQIVADKMIILTKIYHDIEFYIGYNNISYTLLLFILGYYININIFLYGTSIIPHIREITMNKNYNYYIFKRDYNFYYLLYIYQLLYYYMYNPIGLYMILSNMLIYLISIDKLNTYYNIFTLLVLYNDNNIDIKNYIYIHLIINLSKIGMFNRIYAIDSD